MEQLELISICSAESADSPSRADGQESKPSHSAKSKNTPSESCEKTSQEFGYSKTFGNFQQLNFASLSCLPEATRASLSAKPGSAEARKMTATSGLRCLELSEHQGRLGYSLKMLLDTLRWASTKCLLTWKAKTTPCNQLLFQLAPWTPRTDEIESGYWQTPRATDYKGAHNPKTVKDTLNRMGQPTNLQEQVAAIHHGLWATPRSCAAMSSRCNENRELQTSQLGNASREIAFADSNNARRVKQWRAKSIQSELVTAECHCRDVANANDSRKKPSWNDRRVGREQKPIKNTRNDDFKGWSAEPDVGRVAHGIPRRVDRLRGLGNAIVPQVAYEIIKAMIEADESA